MANLAPRDNIFQDLFDFRRDFDHIFSRFLRQGGQQGQMSQRQQASDLSNVMFTPATEAYIDQENKKFVARVAVPGIDPQNVNIEVQGNVLSISGERQLENEQRDADFVHTEFAYGSFERDIMLPEGVDAQNITAEYRNGLLEITAPISAAALPRRVEIKGAGQGVKQMAASAGSASGSRSGSSSGSSPASSSGSGSSSGQGSHR